MSHATNGYFNTLDQNDAQTHLLAGHHDHGTGFAHGGLTGTVTPDFAAIVDDLNGWRESGEVQELQRGEKFQAGADLLGSILRFIASGATLQSCGLRAVAVIAGVRPDLFDCNGSQAKIANRFKVTRAALQKYVREIYRMSGGVFVGPNMRGKEYRANRTTLAVRQHARAVPRPARAQTRRVV